MGRDHAPVYIYVSLLVLLFPSLCTTSQSPRIEALYPIFFRDGNPQTHKYSLRRSHVQLSCSPSEYSLLSRLIGLDEDTSAVGRPGSDLPQTGATDAQPKLIQIWDREAAVLLHERARLQKRSTQSGECGAVVNADKPACARLVQPPPPRRVCAHARTAQQVPGGIP